jgi:SpoIID/LytB domain protein
MSQPTVRVGIMSAKQIEVSFHGTYTMNDGTQISAGAHTFSITDDRRISWMGKTFDEVALRAQSDECTFEIKDVVIGVNFHWERREDQRFSGNARLIVEGEQLTIINELPIEHYLCSVISSEMSANASLELLKAHAVISRSWLLAQINKSKDLASTKYAAGYDSETEYIKWYDREDHINFDVCADDHCQRYQGVTRQTNPNVETAIKATIGEVLMYDGALCDARFSKCCGGVYEEFENCWEDKHYRYLESRSDSEDEQTFPDLTVEQNARQWIMTRPKSFCNTTDAHTLSQVLNNYDQETQDFYRWTVNYSQSELSAIIRDRSGIDFGDIIDLQPVERGTSGRLIKLRIVGTKKKLVIGKELEIRRTLSRSHLYSSAFLIERTFGSNAEVPTSFTLRGAGWGHGVGLCQIGAAVMGANGYDYRQILSHYFLDSDIKKVY